MAEQEVWAALVVMDRLVLEIMPGGQVEPAAQAAQAAQVIPADLLVITSTLQTRSLQVIRQVQQ
jgi:hypothetical protein